MDKGILVLSAFPDIETDFVLAKLYQRNIPFNRINSFALNLDNFSYSFTNQERSLQDFPDTKIVWNRMPFSVRGVISLDSSTEENFIKEEQYWFMRNLGEILPSMPWVNHPAFEERANCKILQLQKAQESNLTSPDTLITNNLNLIKKFREKYENIIFKPIFHSGQLDNNGTSLFTSIVKEEHISKFPHYLEHPGIFQEYIQKEYDLRVLVVGEDVHPIAIYSNSLKDARVDWRKAKFQDLECKALDIPLPIKEGCKNLCKSFGIYTAAIDLAVDKEGTHYFLDLNPGGRWLQFELASKAPISESFISLLSNPPNGSSFSYKKVNQD